MNPELTALLVAAYGMPMLLWIVQKIRWPTAASQLEEVSGYALAKESEDWQASSIVLNIYYIVVAPRGYLYYMVQCEHAGE